MFSNSALVKEYVKVVTQTTPAPSTFDIFLKAKKKAQTTKNK